MRIERAELTRFPDSVAEVIMAAVNEHGVGYRSLDGQHVRLYNGDRDVRPIKIAASRPGPHTLRRLLKWLAVNVPTWKED